MNILVTGASGFMGRALVPALLREGHRVIGLSRRKRPGAEMGTLKNRKFEFVCHDLGKDFGEKLNSEPVDLIYHLASQQPSGPGVHYENYYSGNVETSMSVARFAAKKKVKAVVYVSTASLFCEENHGKASSENSRTETENYYTLTKHMAEKVLQIELSRSKTKLLIFRLPSVYGKNHHGGIVHTYYELAKAGKEIRVFHRGRPVRNLLYIDDAVGAMLRVPRALGHLKKIEFFVLGSEDSLPMAMIAQKIKALSGSSSRIVLDGKKRPGGRDVRLDCLKAKKALKFSPSPIERGLMRYMGEIKNAL